ncbi:MAG TPA: hypothetical protein PLB31_04025 [Fimbriimonadaceae bacterium]|nr:hypothetical protein [Fimbriimonadaceae bacterium]HRE92637.1 hypothetical protein [Fimbriimonadaceae bacterium]HRI73620.1 hypothetical protein [Fimbriimonadaceae bacterium]
MRRQAGRVHWIVLTGIVGALVVAIGFFATFFFGSSPEVQANRFLVSLAKGDKAGLMKYGASDLDPAALDKAWDVTLERGEYYRFAWKILGSTKQSDDAAVVNILINRGMNNSSYDEPMSIPMIKKDGEWKVALSELSRKVYPSLP